MRVAASFTASFAGWCASIASYCLWLGLFSRWQRVTDWNFFLVWPAIIVLIAWVIIALPLTQSRFLQRHETSPHIMMAFGSLIAAIAYMLLVLTWAPVYLFIIFAVIVGAVAGLTYSLLLRYRVRPALALLSCPVALCLWLFLLLPAMTYSFPRFTYHVTSGERQTSALRRILAVVPVGSTWSEVQERFPMLGTSGYSDRLSYTIHLDATTQRVTGVDIHTNRQ